MIAPQWQSKGVGSALQSKLREYAVSRRVKGFIAEVLRNNTKMLSLARAAGDDVSEKDDGESCYITTTF